MAILHLIQTLGRNDARLIRRDSFLIMMLGMIVLIALAVRALMPWVDGVLVEKGLMPSESLELRFSELFPMVIAFFGVFQGATLPGTIFGFLLLDEKDDNTLTAMRVTPVPLRRYLIYRVGAGAAFAFLSVPAMVWVMGQAQVAPWQLLLLGAGACLTAPIVTLFFGITAQNKVQGFAMAKFVSIAGWLIVLGWFVPEPFQWLLAVFPPFLISKAYWLALEGSPLWWVALALGILGQLALIRWMLARFEAGLRA